MNSPPLTRLLLCGIVALLPAPAIVAQPSPAALQAFDTYAGAVETRLMRQHRSTAAYLAFSPAFPPALPPTDQTIPQSPGPRLRRGELIVERLSPGLLLPGALLHHWRATAFAPGISAGDFERLLRDVPAYPRVFRPQVEQATVLDPRDHQMQARLRVKQHHLLTVVLDTTFAIDFAAFDAQHGASTSRSTRIVEIAGSGKAGQAGEDHGFLWRQNTYWSWEQRDGGLYLQVESVSLSRSIPAGLGWAVRPFVESVPRESLTFTLEAALRALEPSRTAAERIQP